MAHSIKMIKASNHRSFQSLGNPAKTSRFASRTTRGVKSFSISWRHLQYTDLVEPVEVLNNTNGIKLNRCHFQQKYRHWNELPCCSTCTCYLVKHEFMKSGSASHESYFRTLKTESRHNSNIEVNASTVDCHNDKLRCNQWLQIRHLNNSHISMNEKFRHGVDIELKSHNLPRNTCVVI